MDYKKDYEAKYKEDVSTFGGHAYDAFLILTKAIEKAGRGQGEGPHGHRDDQGTRRAPAGVFNFSAEDHNGLDKNAFEMLTVKNGKFVVFGELGLLERRCEIKGVSGTSGYSLLFDCTPVDPARTSIRIP